MSSLAISLLRLPAALLGLTSGAGGGPPYGYVFLEDVDGTILLDIDNQPLWGLA
jgi:hypothetical protein